MLYNSVSISGNIFLYPPQGHPISYNDSQYTSNKIDGLKYYGQQTESLL